MRGINLLLTGLAAVVLGSGCSVPIISHGNGISKDMRRVVETVKENGERVEIADFVFTDMVMHDNLSRRSKYVRQFERLRRDSSSYAFDSLLINIEHPERVRVIDGVQWIDEDDNLVVGYVLNDQHSLVTHFVRPTGDEVIVEDMAIRINGRTYSRMDGEPERIMIRREQRGSPLINNVGTIELFPPHESYSGLQDSIRAEYRQVVQDYVRNKKND
ncbi:hypothetical protein HY500_03765 [Candidatus Woesearchaeota archaeon]|nr:hypothetical protein [Candidatus Woesearchaeota archaeon]